MNRFAFIQVVSIAMIAGGFLLLLIKQNRAVGVRTAETLSDRAVWNATNKTAGCIAMAMGALILTLNLWAYAHQWTAWFDMIAEIVLIVSIILFIAATGATVLNTARRSRLRERP